MIEHRIENGFYYVLENGKVIDKEQIHPIGLVSKAVVLVLWVWLFLVGLGLPLFVLYDIIFGG